MIALWLSIAWYNSGVRIMGSATSTLRKATTDAEAQPSTSFSKKTPDD